MAYTFDQKAIGNKGAKAKRVREDGKGKESFSQARSKYRQERSWPGTDRSPCNGLLVQIIAETNKSLLSVDSSSSFMPYYSSDLKSMSPINAVKIFATKV